MKKLDKSEIKVWILSNNTALRACTETQSLNVRNDLYAWVELFHIKLLFYLD